MRVITQTLACRSAPHAHLLALVLHTGCITAAPAEAGLALKAGALIGEAGGRGGEWWGCRCADASSSWLPVGRADTVQAVQETSVVISSAVMAPAAAHLHCWPSASHLHSCQQVPWSSGRGTARRDPARHVALSSTEQSPPVQPPVHSHMPSELQLGQGKQEGVDAVPGSSRLMVDAGAHGERRCGRLHAPGMLHFLPTVSMLIQQHSNMHPTCHGRSSCAGSAQSCAQ